MRWPRVAFVMLLVLLVAPAARSGHELPVYPSYYPHEIEIATLAPERAAASLLDGKLHAYVGSAPRFSGVPPDTIQPVESLGSLVAVRINPASARAKDEASACTAVRAAARAVAANDPRVILHPYPVTPLHGDYLNHVDLAENAKTTLPDTAQAAPDAGDIEIEYVGASKLVDASMTAMNGWLGPPALKSGWYQAYLALRDGVAPRARERVEALAQRLLSGDFADAVERINLERDFVTQLVGGCGNLVIGYTVKREYFNAEFSAGIENIGFDSLTGLNAPIFIRTVKLKDFPWNGWLALGIDARPSAAWNPVAGFTDPFGRLMWSALGDPALLPAPYGSGWMINRVSDVQAAPAR